jgi:GT2 family glycosyltransferase
MCLRALVSQTYPRDRFEVIVVDDGGDCPLASSLAPFDALLRLHLIERGKGGPARARNAGATHASGSLLAFTDDDCEAEPGWLAALHACFSRCPDRAIGGEIVNALQDNTYSAASQLLVDYLYEFHGARQLPDASGGRKSPRFFTSNNLAVPAALFDAIGGFDESFPLAAGEDREFCDRWQQHGYRLLRAPEAVVRHAHALSLPKFWRQHVNYGRGAFHLRRARIARGAPAVELEQFSFYRQLLTYPVRARRQQPALALMTLMFVSQMANALGFALEMRRHSDDRR